MRHLLIFLAIFAAVLANAVSMSPLVAKASTSSTTPFHYRIGRFLGIVPTNQELTQQATAASGGPLQYHDGPTMTTSKVYAIYWQPSGYSFSSGFVPLINRYFTDLQADNGKNTNTYAVATQYSQGSGSQKQFVENNTTFGGSVVDTNPLPPLDPVNCPGAAAGAQSGVSTTNPASMAPGSPWCVTDPQLQQEISTVIKANGWHADNNTEFFMFTAAHIATCFSPAIGAGAGPVGTSVNPPLCSTDYYCAYHSSYFDSTVNPNSQIIYSNMGYAGTWQGEPVTCNQGQAPNGDNAGDSEISVISHEHIESITDPFGTGWWDSSGNEIGDLCNGNYGTTYGPNGAEYSQVINGHHYVMQMEYSNVDGGCLNVETPTLTLTPNIGYPGAPFKVEGLFFGANESVPLTFTSSQAQGQPTTPISIGATTSDASGHLAKLMTAVPASATADYVDNAGVDHPATVTGTGVTSGTSGSASFTVPSP